MPAGKIYAKAKEVCKKNVTESLIPLAYPSISKNDCLTAAPR